jgi:hypothetical protein
MARLHTFLRALLVGEFQRVPERNRDHRLANHHGSSDWLSMADLGSHTLLEVCKLENVKKETQGELLISASRDTLLGLK